jgi:hypothetical protein
MDGAKYQGHTMSQNQFSNLMSQYGNEAEQRKCNEARAEQRSHTFRRVRRVVMLFILAGAMAAAAVYRNEVTSTVAIVLNKFHAPSPYAQAETNTKNKLADIKTEAQKREQEIAATFGK